MSVQLSNNTHCPFTSVGSFAWIRSRIGTYLAEIVRILGASLLIALFAPISIPLPFTPVPLATQSHIVLLMGVLLGGKRAALAVLAYLVQGACGLPVFAGGKAGFALLIGPTAGYLYGYVIAAYFTGLLVEKKGKKGLLGALAWGNSLILLCGWGGLSFLVGLKSAFFLGVVPFVGGDMLKLLALYEALKERKKRG